MKYDRRNMPKCFTFVEDWKEWNRHADIADKPKHRANYCADCLPAFKQQMLAEDRCRFPATSFATQVHGNHVEIVGVRARAIGKIRRLIDLAAKKDQLYIEIDEIKKELG